MPCQMCKVHPSPQTLGTIMLGQCSLKTGALLDKHFQAVAARGELPKRHRALNLPVGVLFCVALNWCPLGNFIIDTLNAPPFVWMYSVSLALHKCPALDNSIHFGLNRDSTRPLGIWLDQLISAEHGSDFSLGSGSLHHCTR